MYKALTQRIAALEADVAQMKSVARAIHPLTHASQKSPESSASASRDEGYAKFHKVGSARTSVKWFCLLCRYRWLSCRCCLLVFHKKQCYSEFATTVC
jgi:hypothetical protein